MIAELGFRPGKAQERILVLRYAADIAREVLPATLGLAEHQAGEAGGALRCEVVLGLPEGLLGLGQRRLVVAVVQRQQRLEIEGSGGQGDLPRHGINRRPRILETPELQRQAAVQDGGVGAEGLLGHQRRQDVVGLLQRPLLDQEPGIGRNYVRVAGIELIGSARFLPRRIEAPGREIQACRDLQRRGTVAAFHDTVQKADRRLLLTQPGECLDAQDVELVAQGAGRPGRLVG